MDSIIKRRLQQKTQEQKSIKEKIHNEQIMPTVLEKDRINDIIQSISDRYKAELADSSTDKDELNTRIKDTIHDEVWKIPINYEQKCRLEKLAVTNIIGLGPLQKYLDDPDITEIIVQRYDNICIEKNGKIYATKATFTDELHLRNVINRILQPVAREVNISTPYADAHLLDGSRICATIPPISPHGATLTVRKFKKMMTPEKYIELGSLSVQMLDFLRKCVMGKVSIYVSGGTGTGKTTFLNMISSFIPGDELIITIEDTLELQLEQKNVRSLETRPMQNANMESVDMSALVKTSLRMRPDRIIVGETRDGAVVSLLTAMSTGHEGSMSTGHANSPENLVNVRIPTMMEMDRSSSFSERAQAMMIMEGIQMIVQLRRLPDGRRAVSHITEVSGISRERKVKLTDIFVYDYASDKFKCTGNIPERIVNHALQSGVKIDREIFRVQTDY